MADAALFLDEVSYKTAEGLEILRSVSWTVKRGGAAAVVGASGSGKSTLLKLCNGLAFPTSGSIEILGRDIHQWPPRDLRASAVWIPQMPSLAQGSARDMLMMPLTFGIISQQQFHDRLASALDVCQLMETLLEREAARLSGGERQRLALARALLLEPKVLLLDEPTASLDGETAQTLLTSLTSWQRKTGCTLVVVTHRLSDVRHLDGELMMLDRGRVRFEGPAATLLNSEDGDEIRRLLTGEVPQ